MSAIALQILGPLRLARADGRRHGIAGERVRDLVGFLALHHGRPQPRERLAETLWGDEGGDAAACLRQTLWRARTALATVDAPGLLRVEVETIRLDAGDGADADWLDLAAFERLTASCARTPGFAVSAEEHRRLEAAAALYQGDLLDGCYRDWCAADRQRLHDAHLRLLDQLVGHAEAHGDHAAGLDWAGRILAVEPAREPTHRAVMRLHLLHGDRTAALRQFDVCAAALARAYGLAPSPRTTALAALARHGDGPLDAGGADGHGAAPTTPDRHAA